MRQLRPAAVYVVDRVYESPLAVRRMERMMTRIDTASVQRVTDDELDELVQEKGWAGSRRVTGRHKDDDPEIVFNAYRFVAPEAERELRQAHGWKGPGLFHGFGAWTHRSRERVREANGIVCQDGIELHSVRGCLFKCQYCYFENILNVCLNIEEFMIHLHWLKREQMEQSLYKWDNGSDILALEPEYGASRLMTEFFGQQDLAHLMHYTKSDNVDCLIGAEHNGQSIMCWTLSCDTGSRVIEPETAPLPQRVAAARRCQEDGYRVRFRFSPIFPVPDWEDEYRAALELVFDQTEPDVISLLTLSRLPDADMVERVFDTKTIEPRFLEAIYDARDDMHGKVYGPLPHELRAEMYRFMLAEIRRLSPDTPVSICLEAPDMWEELAAELAPMRPGRYACCCGGTCTPGHEFLPR